MSSTEGDIQVIWENTNLPFKRLHTSPSLPLPWIHLSSSSAKVNDFYGNEIFHRHIQRLQSFTLTPKKKVDLLLEFSSELEKLLEELVTMNRECRTKSESFFKKRLDLFSEDFRSSLKERLHMNPDMDLESIEEFSKRGKQSAMEYFDNLWNHGNYEIFKEQKKRLGIKLDQLMDEILEKQSCHLQNKKEEDNAKKLLEEIKGVLSNYIKVDNFSFHGRDSKKILKDMAQNISAYLVEKGEVLERKYGQLYWQLLGVIEKHLNEAEDSGVEGLGQYKSHFFEEERGNAETPQEDNESDGVDMTVKSTSSAETLENEDVQEDDEYDEDAANLEEGLNQIPETAQQNGLVDGAVTETVPEHANASEEMEETAVISEDESIQQYRLRWTKHRSTLLHAFEHLSQNKVFRNRDPFVTLVCESESVKCHKMVLAACSSYFRDMFIVDNGNEHHYPDHHQIVILKDVAYSNVKAVLEYMYQGEVIITQDQIPGFLKLVKMLRVKGIVEDDHQNFAVQSESSSTSVSESNSTSSWRESSPDIETISSGGSIPSLSRNITLDNDNPGLQSTPAPMKIQAIVNSVIDHTTFLQLHNVSVELASPITPSLLHQKSPINGNASNDPIEFIDNDGENGTRVQMQVASSEQSHKESIPTVACDNGIKEDRKPDDHGVVMDSKCGENMASFVRARKQRSRIYKYKQYTRNDIQLAIEAVRNQGMSALKAARKFRVPARTVYDRIKRLGIKTYL